MPYTAHQRKVAKVIYRRGRASGASRRQILAALETGLVESNLGNPAGGSGSSVGWRQETASSYPGKNRRNVGQAADRFFREIRGAEGGSAGQMAQAVQRSAFPARYGRRKGQASDLLHWLEKGGGGGSDATSGSLSTTTKTIPGQSFAAERQQVKQSYLHPGGKMPSQNSLLSMSGQLDQLQDVPAQTEVGLKFTKGSPGSGGGKGFDLATRAIHLGQAWSHAAAPYKWGGGHGSIAKPGEAVDCSGFVSALTGLKRPQVSGAFVHWGKPGTGHGKGKVIVFANNGHVLLAARDKHTGKLRWFATSHSNPGGGAGEIAPPSKQYLSHFKARHV